MKASEALKMTLESRDMVLDKMKALLPAFIETNNKIITKNAQKGFMSAQLEVNSARTSTPIPLHLRDELYIFTHSASTSTNYEIRTMTKLLIEHFEGLGYRFDEKYPGDDTNRIIFRWNDEKVIRV